MHQYNASASQLCAPSLREVLNIISRHPRNESGKQKNADPGEDGSYENDRQLHVLQSSAYIVFNEMIHNSPFFCLRFF